jgi:hypothetical protein
VRFRSVIPQAADFSLLFEDGNLVEPLLQEDI